LKVLLIGSYKNAGLRVGQFLSPPNGIYRIASFVKKKIGVDIDVLDVDLEGESKLEELILKNDYDLVGFSLLYPTIQNDIELMYKVKILSPNSVLIAGGQGAVFIAKTLLPKTPLDIVVHGFGEFAVVELIQLMQSGKYKFEEICKIKGLSIKHESKIIESDLRGPFSNEGFDEITSAFDYSIVPYEKYWKFMESKYSPEVLEVMKNNGLLYTIRIMTSSHCPMKCSFCSSTNFLEENSKKNQCVLQMDVNEVIVAIKDAIKAHPKVKAFYFVDDNLLQNSERVTKLCTRLVSELGEKKLNFFCLSRVDNIKKDLLVLMKTAGFKLIIFGVESFSNSILNDMDKKIASKNPSETAQNAILQTLKAEITPLMNLILFYPTTTLKDIEETIEKTIPLIEKGARLTVYSFIEVYPGSNILNEKGLEFSFKKFTINNVDFSLPWTIMPHDPKIKSLAMNSLKLREKLFIDIKNKYLYEKELPHPVFALTFFMAIYILINKPIDRIEKCISILMNEAKKEEKLKVVICE